MKPARCNVCGIHATEEPGPHKGQWLTFADHEPADTAMLSHPQGLEYFCAAHLPRALGLRRLTAEKAMAQLRAEALTEAVKPSKIATSPVTRLKRAIKWLRP